MPCIEIISELKITQNDSSHIQMGFFQLNMLNNKKLLIGRKSELKCKMNIYLPEPTYYVAQHLNSLQPVYSAQDKQLLIRLFLGLTK